MNNYCLKSDVKEREVIVSVIMVTYNHEKYIEKAINGVLMQKTNFDIELLIGEDCSLDRTSNIVKEIYEKHPEIIKAIIRGKNIGALPNMMDLIKRSKGRYVAICDGDDYWTDRFKLQKQVDFLEHNLDYSACCHSVEQIFEDGSERNTIINPIEIASSEARKRGYLNIYDLITMNTVASLSVMYRWSISRKLPEWMKKYKVGDYPLILLHADKGKIGVLDEVMGVYRKHSGGSWWKHNENKEQLCEFRDLLSDIDSELGYRYNLSFQKNIDYLNNSINNSDANNCACGVSKCFGGGKLKRIIKKILPKKWTEKIKNILDLQENIKVLQERVNLNLENGKKVSEKIQKLTQDNDMLKLKTILLWDGIKWLKNKQEQGKIEKFLDLLQYYIALGNFNQFYDNYDEIFADKKNVEDWTKSVKHDFTRNVETCLSQISEDEIKSWEEGYSYLANYESKDIYVRLLVWRILGFTKIKLMPDDVVCEEKKIREVLDKSLVSMDEINEVKFTLRLYNLNPLGYPISCYAIPESIIMDFVRKQYENDFVKVSDGDVVLDCGGCWGDTALLFASKVGNSGHVYSFEFVPENIAIFEKNMAMNGDLKRKITIVPHPVSDVSNIVVPFHNNGTATSISVKKVDVVNDNQAKTISIDDFIEENGISKVSFIKMDIEGAEQDAIIGARRTILKFRPKIALAIYHKPEDIWKIITMIKQIEPRYKLYIKHNTRSSLETILLGQVVDESEGENNDI